MSNIMVSVICTTYNHEKYIKDALDSFISQRTNFDYEILVHDDASTDNTAAVIREYEQKYPNMIKPIYQKENQYSKGVSIIDSFLIPIAKGKYIAICEGDDYWCDSSKLQRQVNLLEKHPECDICAHSYISLDITTNKTNESKYPYTNAVIIPVSQVIIGGGGLVATASLMYRKEIVNNTPNFRRILSLDYTLQVHGALRGGMLFIPRVMSVYRVNVNGSWTMRSKNDINNRIHHRQRVYKMLKQLDLDTNGKYHDIICYLRFKSLVKLCVFYISRFICKNMNS